MSNHISFSEVKKHNNNKSVWMVIHNEVYDVSTFLEEHPGGVESLMEFAGQDASQGFEDVGHSDDARILMKKYKIGILPPGERTKTNTCSKLKWAVLALAGAIVIGVVLRKYLS